MTSVEFRDENYKLSFASMQILVLWTFILLFSCSRLQHFIKWTYFWQSGHMKRVLVFDFKWKRKRNIKILPNRHKNPLYNWSCNVDEHIVTPDVFTVIKYTIQFPKAVVHFTVKYQYMHIFNSLMTNISSCYFSLLETFKVLFCTNGY